MQTEPQTYIIKIEIITINFIHNLTTWLQQIFHEDIITISHKTEVDFYNSRNSQTAYQNFFSPPKKKLKDIP